MYKPIGNFPRGLYPLGSKKCGLRVPAELCRKNPASQTAREFPRGGNCTCISDGNVLLRLTLVSRFSPDFSSSSTSATNSASTIAVAPQTRASSTSKYGTFMTTLRRQDARSLLPQHPVRLTQKREWDFDQALDFVRGEVEVWPLRREADDRVQQMTTDEHRERGEPAQHLDLRRDDADLFVRLAQARPLRPTLRHPDARPGATPGRYGGAG